MKSVTGGLIDALHAVLLDVSDLNCSVLILGCNLDPSLSALAYRHQFGLKLGAMPRGR